MEQPCADARTWLRGQLRPCWAAWKGVCRMLVRDLSRQPPEALLCSVAHPNCR